MLVNKRRKEMKKMEKEQEGVSEDLDVKAIASDDLETNIWPFEIFDEDMPSYELWRGECENPF
jgi:hypothetical protein